MASDPKTQQYGELYAQLDALTKDETRPLPNTANMSALLFNTLADINWAGFYWYDGKELVLGAFQGKPACIRIAMGRGVCGTAAKTLRSQIVPDVHAFAGHIACDADSQSELVIPLVYEGRLLGVLDIDSAILNRFDQTDLSGLTRLCDLLLSRCDWARLM